MAITIQHKRDTAANWTSNNPTLAAGEFGFETDTGKLKLGDGSTAWSSLGYFEPGAGAGAPSYSFQGSTSGYISGGFESGATNKIEKYPFSSDSDATDVGDLTVARYYVAGQSSSDNGYTSGGTPVESTIDKFPFSSDANATDVGDLSVCKREAAGQSSSTHGYTSGGVQPDGTPGNESNVIDKFPVSSDANATDVGDLTVARKQPSGQSSSTHGYNSAGQSPFNPIEMVNVIDKFSFSSDANATDVGDLTCARAGASGQSSADNGYASGGNAPPRRRMIDKFPFSSDANATFVGNLLANGYLQAGASSTTHGYAAGRSPAANTIEKFSFTTDSNATDVANLTAERSQAAGQQV